MRRLSKLFLSASFLLGLTLPAFAGLTVTTPLSPSNLSSPFPLSAAIDTCSGEKIASMGYSVNYGPTTVFMKVSTLDTQVTLPPGGYTLHVKAWGNHGAVCVSDVAITVSNFASAVPLNAASAGSLQAMGSWRATTDAGTPGSATGKMAMSASPSLSGHARQFSTTFANYGGERYSLSFGDDVDATNFLYDASVYIDGSASGLVNIEMDMNQVMSNGQTVIYGVQCSGWTGTWEYTTNAGTPEKPVDKWVSSTAPCDPQKWAVDTWHHIQISYSRDDLGAVTYNYVSIDGNQQNIDVKTPSSFALGWAPVLVTNFQIDGATATGSTASVYLDNLTISRW